MQTWRSKLSRTKRGQTVEYEYIFHVKALETMARLMKKENVSVSADFALVSIKSPRLLDMKKFEDSLFSSYIVIKLQKEEEVVEEFVEDGKSLPLLEERVPEEE